MLRIVVPLALMEEREIALRKSILKGLVLKVNTVLGLTLCIASFLHFFFLYFLLPLPQCACPSSAVAVQIRPGLTVGDLLLCSSVGPLWCSAAPHKHGRTVRCSAANPLINLGPSTITVCQKEVEEEEHQHLTHLQEN